MYNGNGIDRLLFNTCYSRTAGRVSYELGAKSQLGSDSSSFNKSDCSNYTAWMLSRVAPDMITAGFGGGSAQQHEWCNQNLVSAFYDLALMNRENVIYIAFMDQVPGTQEVTRHVWFLQNGATIECCGGEGVCSSDEHAKEYEDRCSGCYVIPSYIP
jgi:hypothetical protein